MKFKELNINALPEIAQIFKALSDTARLRIMASLHDGEKAVSEIVSITGLQQANTSKHLQILSKAGLLKSRRDGSTIFYGFSDPTVFKICDVVCSRYTKMIKAKAEMVS